MSWSKWFASKMKVLISKSKLKHIYFKFFHSKYLDYLVPTPISKPFFLGESPSFLPKSQLTYINPIALNIYINSITIYVIKPITINEHTIHFTIFENLVAITIDLHLVCCFKCLAYSYYIIRMFLFEKLST